MTSLGGQFSARRPGDSPFTIRTEVTGGLESRGALRKMSDLLELVVKRMDTLARLENSSELHRAPGHGHGHSLDRGGGTEWGRVGPGVQAQNPLLELSRGKR
ncbi:Alpha-1,6-mannosylglycoprotein 6-beta-N-acetylglucosaminyltransferase B [Myotis brandtii]|uniref:Alpha-1,6-mannosylglycoprotein 6-beta-N-acetylglucosaminyltransferase B n=1 Tax=Myotis brandtii TaxID=109478 RepID=S7Q6E3_MYOBR|nr:Alpha-1,6-mannosylglycoprotein 6-beta-N-acetylglucosaminyltransferase B [Myotis brandtii]